MTGFRERLSPHRALLEAKGIIDLPTASCYKCEAPTN